MNRTIDNSLFSKIMFFSYIYFIYDLRTLFDSIGVYLIFNLTKNNTPNFQTSKLYFVFYCFVNLCYLIYNYILSFFINIIEQNILGNYIILIYSLINNFINYIIYLITLLFNKKINNIYLNKVTNRNLEDKNEIYSFLNNLQKY